MLTLWNWFVNFRRGPPLVKCRPLNNSSFQVHKNQNKNENVPGAFVMRSNISISSSCLGEVLYHDMRRRRFALAGRRDQQVLNNKSLSSPQSLSSNAYYHAATPTLFHITSFLSDTVRGNRENVSICTGWKIQVFFPKIVSAVISKKWVRSLNEGSGMSLRRRIRAHVFNWQLFSIDKNKRTVVKRTLIALIFSSYVRTRRHFGALLERIESS